LYKIPIVYEDNHMLVVDKPPNLLSQKDSSGDMDLLTLLKEDLKIRYNKPGNVYLGLVHRLDRPVGGVMVLAKTSKCAARLSEQLRNRDFNKTYIALIYGRPNKPKSTLVHYLIKDEKRNRVFSVQKVCQEPRKPSWIMRFWPVTLTSAWLRLIYLPAGLTRFGYNSLL